jgi:hypothetical protein
VLKGDGLCRRVKVVVLLATGGAIGTSSAVELLIVGFSIAELLIVEDDVRLLLVGFSVRLLLCALAVEELELSMVSSLVMLVEVLYWLSARAVELLLVLLLVVDELELSVVSSLAVFVLVEVVLELDWLSVRAVELLLVLILGINGLLEFLPIIAK